MSSNPNKGVPIAAHINFNNNGGQEDHVNRQPDQPRKDTDELIKQVHQLMTRVSDKARQLIHMEQPQSLQQLQEQKEAETKEIFDIIGDILEIFDILVDEINQQRNVNQNTPDAEKRSRLSDAAIMSRTETQLLEMMQKRLDEQEAKEARRMARRLQVEVQPDLEEDRETDDFPYVNEDEVSDMTVSLNVHYQDPFNAVPLDEDIIYVDSDSETETSTDKKDLEDKRHKAAEAMSQASATGIEVTEVKEVQPDLEEDRETDDFPYVNEDEVSDMTVSLNVHYPDPFNAVPLDEDMNIYVVSDSETETSTDKKDLEDKRHKAAEAMSQASATGIEVTEVKEVQPDLEEDRETDDFPYVNEDEVSDMTVSLNVHYQDPFNAFLLDEDMITYEVSDTETETSTDKKDLEDKRHKAAEAMSQASATGIEVTEVKEVQPDLEEDRETDDFPYVNEDEVSDMTVSLNVHYQDPFNAFLLDEDMITYEVSDSETETSTDKKDLEDKRKKAAEAMAQASATGIEVNEEESYSNPPERSAPRNLKRTRANSEETDENEYASAAVPLRKEISSVAVKNKDSVKHKEENTLKEASGTSMEVMTPVDKKFSAMDTSNVVDETPKHVPDAEMANDNYQPPLRRVKTVRALIKWFNEIENNDDDEEDKQTPPLRTKPQKMKPQPFQRVTRSMARKADPYGPGTSTGFQPNY